MTILLLVLLIIVIVGVVGGVIALTIVFVTGRVKQSSARAVEATFAPGEVLRSDPMANFFGWESKGGRQIRGNGALVLTGQRLWFRRAGAAEPLEIPLSAVTGVDIVRSHNGKSVRRDLLRVAVQGDSVAWWVREPAAWEGHLRSLLPR
ncbi:hypothetical protein [Nocardia harenae]|uniref:hypothetical protein n=1 Tax=Nocardia harenae TaxID=358707 RepID=UPI00082F39FD|nr:hypothetical protein [Nocardia harenae]